MLARFALAALSGALPVAFAQDPQVFYQPRVDGPGVVVDAGGTLLHRPLLINPTSVQGTIILDLTLDANGEVADARVESGPVELRRAALLNVLRWHYATSPMPPIAPRAIVQFSEPGAPAPTMVRTGVFAANRVAIPPSIEGLGAVARIDYVALTPALEQLVRAQISLREGDALTPESSQALTAALKQVDQHLTFAVGRQPMGSVTVRIQLLPEAAATPVPMLVAGITATPPVPGGPIRVRDTVEAANLVSQVAPVYPALAKQARIQGTVRFQLVIDKDGAVKEIQLLSGHPLLVPAAQEAVKQWTYKPTLLNGQPVEVLTQVDVTFTLTQ